MAAPLPTGVSQAEANTVFADLVAKGEAAKQAYITTHCPAYLLANLADYQGNLSPPLSNGQSVHVVQADGSTEPAGSPGQAVVINGALVSIRLTV